MPNEKLMILKMLEEGKISASEAGRLLEAAGGDSPYQPPREAYRPAPPRPPAAPSAGPAPAGNDNGRAYTSAPRPTASYDTFASDLSRRFDAFARDLEPKLQKLSETVVEKTADFADRISKSLDDSRRTSAPPSPAPAAPPSPDGLSKRYELSVTPGYNELNISGLNGDVLIHGYNGDKISATVSCKAKRVNAALSLMRLGNKYFLNYDEDEFERVSIDAYVPENMFNVISINTINGALDVSTLSADSISLNNSNGQTKLQSLSSDFLKAECNNGRLNIGAVKAKNARVENFNGAIDALDLDCANLRLTSVNGGIIVNMSQYAAYADYVWDVESSNGKTTLNLPAHPDLGYHVKAHASLGQIRIGMANLNFLYNSASLAEAKSINYDGCRKKVKLALETSNATLQIN